jgi:hypothetical protein
VVTSAQLLGCVLELPGQRARIEDRETPGELVVVPADVIARAVRAPPKTLTVERPGIPHETERE